MVGVREQLITYDMIEEKTAQTILEERLNVMVGKRTYSVAHPTIATLIEVSRLISKMPKMNLDGDETAVISALSNAKDVSFLGDILAVLIVGKKRQSKFSLFRLKEKLKLKRLSRKILNRLSPKELYSAFFQIMNSFEIGFFLQTTIFLQEVSLTKPTKTTASGR